MMKFAYRNLWRRKRRTIITAISIGFGLWLAVLVIGVRESTSQKFIALGAKSGFGYLTIVPQDFRVAEATVSRMTLPSQVYEKVKKIPHVTDVLNRRVGEAMLQSPSSNSGALWYAIDPANENPRSNLFCEYATSQVCQSKTWEEGAVLGSTLAKKLKLSEGDQFVYTLQFANNQNISLLTSVNRVFKTGASELDAHVFLLPKAELHKQLPESAQYDSFTAIYVDHSAYVEQTLENIQRLLPADMKVIPWQETQPSLVEYFALDRLMYNALLFFISLIIACGIATCMNMSFIERRKEFGTMLAIGMYPRHLLALLLTESLLLGVVGMTMGVIAISPFYAYLNIWGVDATLFFGHAVEGGGVSETSSLIHCTLLPEQMLGILLTPLISSLLATLIPAIKAAYTLPIEIIREA